MTSHRARVRVTRNAGPGFSLIELLIVVAIILIIAAIAIPNFIRSRITANEASAVSTLRTLNTSLVSYANTYPSTTGAVAGQCGFPGSLANLGPPAAPPASSAAADLVDAVLGRPNPVMKSGYSFNYSVALPGNPDPNGCNVAFTISAVPVSVGSTGQRGFFTDRTTVIHYTTDGTAPNPLSPVLQ